MNGLDFTAISKVDVWVAGSALKVTRFYPYFPTDLRKNGIKIFKKNFTIEIAAQFCVRIQNFIYLLRTV